MVTAGPSSDDERLPDDDPGRAGPSRGCAHRDRRSKSRGRSRAGPTRGSMTAAAPDQYPKGKQRMDTESLRRTVARLDAGSPRRARIACPCPVHRVPGTPRNLVIEAAERTAGAASRCGVRRRGVEAVPWGYPPVVGEIAGPEGSPTVVLYAHYDVRRRRRNKDGPPTPGRLGCATTAVSPGGEPPTTRVGSRSTSRPCEPSADGRAGYASSSRGWRRPLEPRGLRACAPGPVRCGRVRGRRHGQPGGRRAHAHDDAPGRRVMRRHGLDPRAPTALGSVRGPARRDDGARLAAGHPARRCGRGGRRGRHPSRRSERRRLGIGLPSDGGSAGRHGPDRHRPDRRPTLSSPSVSAIGIDTPTVEGSSNVLLPSARAKLSMRIVPGADPGAELDALARHLDAHAPWGATVEVERVKLAPPFRCRSDGPAFVAARTALEEAWAAAGRSWVRWVDPAARLAASCEPQGGVHPVGRRGHGARIARSVARSRMLGRAAGRGMTLAATGPILG